MEQKQIDKSIKVSVETLKRLKRIALDNDEKLYETVERLSKTEETKTPAKRK